MREPVVDGQPAGEPGTSKPPASHVATLQHSAWVARWIGQPRRHGRLLDFASGSGRHARLALAPALLLPGGRLIYETFAQGNEAYGKPSNPAFLLQPDELFLLARRAGMQVRAFEQGRTDVPKPALVQRMVAVRLPDAGESLSLS